MTDVQKIVHPWQPYHRMETAEEVYARGKAKGREQCVAYLRQQAAQYDRAGMDAKALLVRSLAAVCSAIGDDDEKPTP